MEPTTQNNTLRTLLIFVIIGAVLLAAVVLGMRWAKGRSDQIANNQHTQQPASPPKTDDTKKPEEQEPSPVVVAPTPAPASSAPSVAPSTSTTVTPSHVPKTGPEDSLLPIAAIAALVFASINYVQSRRRLVHL
jgi:hypothetical protein